MTYQPKSKPITNSREAIYSISDFPRVEPVLRFPRKTHEPAFLRTRGRTTRRGLRHTREFLAPAFTIGVRAVLVSSPARCRPAYARESALDLHGGACQDAVVAELTGPLKASAGGYRLAGRPADMRILVRRRGIDELRPAIGRSSRPAAIAASRSPPTLGSPSVFRPATECTPPRRDSFAAAGAPGWAACDKPLIAPNAAARESESPLEHVEVGAVLGRQRLVRVGSPEDGELMPGCGELVGRLGDPPSAMWLSGPAAALLFGGAALGRTPRRAPSKHAKA